VGWVDGPGKIVPNPNPWSRVSNDYLFVDNFVSIRPKVTGIANQVRFDFWANTFLYMQAVAKAECIWGDYNAALTKVYSTTRDPDQQRTLAKQTVLPLRESLVKQTGVMMGYLQQAVCSTGTLGTIMNIEQHSLPSMLDNPGNDLASLMGYIGCFNDKEVRDLNGSSISYPQMTPGFCLNYCSKFNYKYYATQYKTYCFCGNGYGKYGSVRYTECNMTCGGDSNVDCGGTWVNSVYLVQQLPDSAVPSNKYTGAPRLIVPTARSDLSANEQFTQTVMVLSEHNPDSVMFSWRLMGTQPWTTHPMSSKTTGRQVYYISLENPKNDFEYYVDVTVGGQHLYFPATYPSLPQTVVVIQ